MDLILWRHAEAHDQAEGQADGERRLTPKGERQARRMAQWLDLQLPATARVLVSPTQRTRQTVAALPRSIEIVPTLGPEGTVAALLQAAHWPAAGGTTLVVGHQPTLGLTVAWLLAGATQPWSVRKGAVWWLRQRDRAATPEVLLHAVIPPERL